MTNVNTFSLVAFRARWPWKPYQLVMLEGQTVEVISFPWPNGDGAAVNVRTTPGDPTTMKTVDAASLQPTVASTLERTQALLAEHQTTCPNFRAVPRRDCAMCDGIARLAADIMAIMPPAPLVLDAAQFHKNCFLLSWPRLGDKQ